MKKKGKADKQVIDRLLQSLGKLYSEELGIDLKSGKEDEIFKWFVASILFGKRISEEIAAKTYREFEKAGVLTPARITEAGWHKLVALLDEGGYVRYDFSTATRLLEIAEEIKKKGSLSALHKSAGDERGLEKRLQEFSGVGPVTANIFLRELRGIWPKSNPKPSPLTKLAADNLGIDLKDMQWNTEKFARLECALLRLGKTYCKKNRCTECDFQELCQK